MMEGLLQREDMQRMAHLSRRLRQVFGDQVQLHRTAEECSEVAVEALHYARRHARPRPVRQPVLPRHRAPAPPSCFGEARFRVYRPEPVGYDRPMCCATTVCQCHRTNFTTIWGNR